MGDAQWVWNHIYWIWVLGGGVSGGPFGRFFLVATEVRTLSRLFQITNHLPLWTQLEHGVWRGLDGCHH